MSVEIERMLDELLRIDALRLEDYCVANSDPTYLIQFDRRHLALIVTNRSGKSFAFLTSSVADALREIWESPLANRLAAYDERLARGTFGALVADSLVGSLSESQTRATWEVLRVAGGFSLGLGRAIPAQVFATQVHAG